jgi:hypothetical protein
MFLCCFTKFSGDVKEHSIHVEATCPTMLWHRQGMLKTWRQLFFRAYGITNVVKINKTVSFEAIVQERDSLRDEVIALTAAAKHANNIEEPRHTTTSSLPMLWAVFGSSMVFECMVLCMVVVQSAVVFGWLH